MGQPVIQHSFNSGELAPALWARTDLTSYHKASALLRNYYVDYRGGASSRPGTKYILQCYNSANPVRLIPFQASFSVGYILEFGEQYIRFYTNGGPVLESALTITGATKANPCVVTVTNSYNIGDWVYITGVAGMTQLNGRYFKVIARAAGTITLGKILDGSNVDSTGYSTYTSGGTAQRVYTLPSPYSAADLALLKFAQNVSTLVLTHPSYVPYVLTLIAAANWTIVPIVFGATIAAPGGMGAATTAASDVNYSYIVTSVDVNGQESNASAIASSTVSGVVGVTITVSWTAVTGAQSYNVYRAGPRIAGVVPVGSAFGFVSNVTGVSFSDAFANIVSVNPADYDFTPPLARNPFQGAGVASITVTAAGTYTTVPSLTVAAAPAGGITATANVILGVIGTPTIAVSGILWGVGNAIIFPNGVVLIVATVNGSGQILTFQPITFPGSNPGATLGAGNTTPANPVTSITLSGAAQTCTANMTWGVVSASIVSQGAGYTSVPAVTPSAGGATFTAVLATSTAGKPSVPGFYQQRLVLAGPTINPQRFNFSRPGSPYNFDVSNPIQPDDAIEGTLVSGQLNTIKALIPMPSGLVALSDRQAWLINGGSAGAPLTPINATAQAQAYNGASDVPPIVANFDILYVQAKGSIVRDLTYNFYTNIYTGTDISVLSSHLFYGYTVTEWAWAEEPFKLVWAVRDDGTMLTLTFLKEQELIGWAHSDTTGDFKSVATVVESTTDAGDVDAVYTVVERVISTNTVKYVERFAERIFPNGKDDAWCVDAGLQYNGSPATSFTGGEHLAGATCTGLADGEIVASFVMAAGGTFTLSTAASKVTVGLAFTPQLQTLPIDLGEPTAQGKTKKISGIVLKVQETLGLTIGSEETNQVVMRDLVDGAVSGMRTGLESQVINGLVTGDAFQIINPTWNVPGQYFINQPNPYPSSILGVVPQIDVGGV